MAELQTPKRERFVMEVLTQALINSRASNDSVQWRLRVQTSLEIRIPILKKNSEFAMHRIQ